MHTTTLAILFADYAQTKAARGMAYTRRCLYLPYCLQLGDNFGYPDKALILNRFYQPLLVIAGGTKRVHYDEYPSTYWVSRQAISVPADRLDIEGRHWFYKDSITPSKYDKKLYKDYKKRIQAVLSKVMHTEITVGSLT